MVEIAIVHEWLGSRAGSEKTFEEIGRALPDADVFALSRSPGVEFDFGARQIATTWLDNALLRERRMVSLPLMPLAWSSLGRHAEYDVVLTSSHAFANLAGVTRQAGTVLCYCHTPIRYVWTPELDARGKRFGRWADPVRSALGRVDLVGARRVTEFAANSTETAERIKRFYGVDARVISPPVETEFFSAAPDVDLEPRVDVPVGSLMAMSRFVGYKRLDLAISVAAKLGRPIVVVGSGPDEQRLREHAGDCGADAHFFIRPDQSQLRELYHRVDALVFPAHEDFGIVPVEAQAAGTPVVALRAGGTLDSVVDGVTGALAESQTVEAFVEATRRALDLNSQRSATSSACRTHASEFSSERFRSRIMEWVSEHVD